MGIVDISDVTFADETKGPGVVVVDFWAPWCNPCKAFAPILDEVDEEIGDQVKMTKFNCDEYQESEEYNFYMNEYGVMSIPTLLVFKDGEVVDKLVGVLPKDEIIETLQKHI